MLSRRAVTVAHLRFERGLARRELAPACLGSGPPRTQRGQLSI